MFDKIFAKKEPAAVIPDGLMVYAIGDIHGCTAELDTLLEKIDADCESANLAEAVFADGEKTPPGKAKIVFLGDYVDRGPDSKGVIDRLIALKAARPNSVFLKGNHEASMLHFMKDPEDMMHWLDWGGAETLQSYGVGDIDQKEPRDIAAELMKALPEDHLGFLNSLSLTHQEGDYLFVHAGLRPGIALAEQREEDLLWIRGRFHKTAPKDRPEFVVVHGHHPIKKPQDEGWRIAVDTGACWTGMLTAVALSGTSRRFITT